MNSCKKTVNYFSKPFNTMGYSVKENGDRVTNFTDRQCSVNKPLELES